MLKITSIYNSKALVAIFKRGDLKDKGILFYVMTSSMRGPKLTRGVFQERKTGKLSVKSVQVGGVIISKFNKTSFSEPYLTTVTHRWRCCLIHTFSISGVVTVAVAIAHLFAHITINNHQI